MSAKTAEHDSRRLRAQVKKFLKKGYEVKVTIRMRGREKRTLLWRAKELMEEFTKLGKIKLQPRLNGAAYIATII